MEKITASKVTLADLRRLVEIRESGIAAYAWTQVEQCSLSDRERTQLQEITAHLLNYETHLMNEATVWGRGIYPLLLLAERGQIQAWAGVLLKTRYPQFEVEGEADGVLGRWIAGSPEAPYLVVVEAKRGLEAQNPRFQLYANLLAAARLNWELNPQLPQEIFGCYTIADTWTFLRAEVDQIDSDRPTLSLESSREYVEKLEAATILQFLKQIIDRHEANQPAYQR